MLAGRCSRGAKCSYVHDPARVAICSKYVLSVVKILSPSLHIVVSRFLRGMCDKTDGSCPFSHNVSKEKVCLCLAGVAQHSPLPFLSPDASVFVFHSWIMH